MVKFYHLFPHYLYYFGSYTGKQRFVIGFQTMKASAVLSKN